MKFSSGRGDDLRTLDDDELHAAPLELPAAGRLAARRARRLLPPRLGRHGAVPAAGHHPWWYPLGSPSNIEWRPCASNRNVALYINPMVGIINPIGAGISSMTPLANWNWLDDLYWSWYSGGAPFGALFMNEDGSNGSGTTGLANVNPGSGSAWLWCALHSAGTVYPLQPSQDPRLVAAPLTNTMRVSCEWLRGSTPFGDPRGGNIQSFMIWR
jgi:hypothetical protein